MLITKEMSIREAVEFCPATIQTFKDNGMGCLGCAMAKFENIEQGAKAHGIDIDDLICELNMVATRAESVGSCDQCHGCHEPA